MNNAFNVMVTQVNSKREDTCRHYTKLLDEARQRKKHTEDQIVRVTHTARADIDTKRVIENSIVTRLSHGSSINIEMTKWEETKLKERCLLARRKDFLQVLEDAKENCEKNEEQLQTKIRNISYLTPSKGEKHWVITRSEGQLGWIPHEED